MYIHNQKVYFHSQPNLVYHTSIANPSYLIDYQYPQHYNVTFLYQNNLSYVPEYGKLTQMKLPNEQLICQSFQNHVPKIQNKVVQNKDLEKISDQIHEHNQATTFKSESEDQEGKKSKVQTNHEHKIRKKYKQNAQRNVLTNIGNQLLTFLGSRKKSEHVFKMLNKQACQQQIQQFYGFIHKLRKRKKSPIYFNQEKLLEIWFPRNNKLAMSKNFKLLRQMSLVFIQKFLPLFMLNSVRIKKQTKVFHISTAHKLLHLLRYQQQM